jgi:squalene synthase HpnC
VTHHTRPSAEPKLDTVHAGPFGSPDALRSSAHRAPLAADSRGRAASVKERAENFPVALRILPKALQVDLRAVYDVCRLIDDVGDEATGDRTAWLSMLAAELTELWRGGPVTTPELRRLVPTVRVHDLREEPFQRLVRANLQDQRVFRYADSAELLAYCALSAAPIGRLVLALFDATTDERTLASDRVCAGLQLVEHWQDVAEDRRAGRVYLPQDALAEFGVPETDLDAPVASPALRRLVLAETRRADELLDAGNGLVRGLRGWARIAVAGYLAGGRATVDALRQAGGEVLSGPPRPRRRDVLRHLVVALIGRSSTDGVLR